MDHDLAQTRALWGQLLPKPRRHVLDRGIFQTRDFVQIRMIELRDKRPHCSADLSVIIDPAARAIDLAFDRHFYLEAVSMHVATFMALRR